MGDNPHRMYIPWLMDGVASRKADPRKVPTEVEPMTDVISVSKAFDKSKAGWVRVELRPGK